MLPNLKNSTSAIIIFFIIWRLFLFSISYLSKFFIPVFGNRFPYVGLLEESKLPYWVWSFGNFDGVHYLRIAQDGYAYQFTQAFFPLYPILTRLVSYLTFGNFLIAALAISNGAFLAGLILFNRLMEKKYSEKIAFWSCIFLLAFPTSFYFGAAYTEGIFFLMTIGCFYLLERKKIFLASIVGAFASATRLVGMFLASSFANQRNYKSLIALLTVFLGLASYMIYLKIKFDNPFYFLTAQSIWGQERSTTGIIILPQVFWRYFKIILTTTGLPLVNALFELSSTVFAIAMLILATKRVRTEWIVFSSLAVLTPTLTGTLASMPRYILIAFPIYIVLAHIKSNTLKLAILAIFVMFLTIATALFTRGYWVA